jgi:hypothetical protein
MPAARAPGPDKLPVAALRLHPVAKALANIATGIMRQESPAPAEWLVAEIVPVPKKPNATSLDAHRGISLMSCAAKAFNKVLLRRIEPSIDPLLRTEQNGFRRKRGQFNTF